MGLGFSHAVALAFGDDDDGVVQEPVERRSLGIASHWPFDAWGRFLPENLYRGLADNSVAKIIDNLCAPTW